MFGAVARFLANSAGPAGTLLVLDDLHWAGEDALDLLATLLREPGSRPLRVVAAYRDTDVGPRGPLPMLLADLAREGLAVRADLEPLLPAEAAELLALLLAEMEPETEPGRDTEGVRQQILARAGGLPFYLVSCAQEARASPRAGRPAQFAVPWTVMETIRQRVAIVSDATQDVLALAAVAGRQAPRSVLLAASRASGQDDPHTLAGLEAACHARLLAEVDDGSYIFAHDLIRETVVADLIGARRATLHRQVAEALEALPDAPRRAAELAWHFAEGDAPAHALPYALTAGAQADARYAHAEAEVQYRLAVTLAQQTDARLQEAVAFEQLGYSLEMVGRHLDAEDALAKAVSLYRTLGETERFAWASARLARLYDRQRKITAGVQCLESVLSYLLATDTAHQVNRIALWEPLVTEALSKLSRKVAARLNVSIGNYLARLGRPHDSLIALERGVQDAEAADDDAVHGLAQYFRGEMYYQLGKLDAAKSAWEEAVRRTESANDLDILCVALMALAAVVAERGDLARSNELFARALMVAERVGDPLYVASVHCNSAELALFMGEWTRAAAGIERATDALRSITQSYAATLALLGNARLRLWQGATEDDAMTPPAVLAEAENSPDLRLRSFARQTLAEVDLVQSNPAAASVRLAPLLDEAYYGVLTVTAALPFVAWSALGLGEIDKARDILKEAEARASEER
jgi:tetratricopeptide (TPR) repeat protein